MAQAVPAIIEADQSLIASLTPRPQLLSDRNWLLGDQKTGPSVSPLSRVSGRAGHEFILSRESRHGTTASPTKAGVFLGVAGSRLVTLAV
jgi:hypothetical protein